MYEEVYADNQNLVKELREKDRALDELRQASQQEILDLEARLDNQMTSRVLNDKEAKSAAV